MRTMSSTSAHELVAVVLRDSSGRILVINTGDMPAFVLPFGAIDSEVDPALAAIAIAHEAIGMQLEKKHLRRLGTYTGGPKTQMHVYLAQETVTNPQPNEEIPELAWVDPAAPDVDVAPLLKDSVFPAVEKLDPPSA